MARGKGLPIVCPRIVYVDYGCPLFTKLGAQDALLDNVPIEGIFDTFSQAIYSSNINILIIHFVAVCLLLRKKFLFYFSNSSYNFKNFAFFSGSVNFS